ncbi:lipoyl(octanoyl) transferase LipB [Thermoflexibacter ruber]|uniref:Octanoyltransferase n=1 Tax=Thermoflexibacter ruber TaxID=1003 RepID=A0A1I2IUQ6_9BACT|nr:lipoyl(octanoyl) transferase LipB [Thermoflexibacter ruber]SFF46014.1 lipoyl(octanoyl) transferase [Thermoflexibacter ruber]
MKNHQTIFQHWGIIPYKEAWEKQESLFQKVIAQKVSNRQKLESEQIPTTNYLIFCEHSHVYTLGKSGDEQNLLLSEAVLKERNIDYFHTNRGGDITYHGFGQIVGYPIFDLDNFFTDIGKYLRTIEEAVILTLAEYGVTAGRIEKLTGVWIDFEEQKNPRKICAIGVRASRWVTMHGFALNINTDLDYFKNIVPCGIADKAVTSLAQELGREVSLREVENTLLKYLVELFDLELIEHFS